MSKEKYSGLSETNKNIAIEIHNKLEGISILEASEILESILYFIKADSTVKEFLSKPEPITIKIAQ